MGCMSTPNAAQILTAARDALATPLSFDDVLAALATKDRQNAERRLAALDADPHRGLAWRRLACALMTLAPIAKFVGRDGVEFFVPDGRYRKQVFALEDLHDGNLAVYCPDVLDEAVAAGLLSPTGAPEPHGFAVAASGDVLNVEPLDGTALSPNPHVKNLTNWKRRALRLMLVPRATPAAFEAAELLCAIAAGQFAPAQLPPDNLPTADR